MTAKLGLALVPQLAATCPAASALAAAIASAAVSIARPHIGVLHHSAADAGDGAPRWMRDVEPRDKFAREAKFAFYDLGGVPRPKGVASTFVPRQLLVIYARK